MADNLVLKVSVRTFVFIQITQEPWEGFERRGMLSDLAFTRILLEIL